MKRKVNRLGDDCLFGGQSSFLRENCLNTDIFPVVLASPKGIPSIYMEYSRQGDDIECNV